jgi:hypothetical protein
MPATSTSALSVSVLGFTVIRLLTQCDRLVCDSCSSGQCFAFGFLPTTPHGNCSCRSAKSSPDRACRGLTIYIIHLQVKAPCRAHTKKSVANSYRFSKNYLTLDTFLLITSLHKQEVELLRDLHMQGDLDPVSRKLHSHCRSS